MNQFKTIQQIQNHQFIGNHAADCDAFNRIEAFARNESHSVADRAEAVRIMQDKGMGAGRSEEMSDEQFLTAFLEC